MQYSIYKNHFIIYHCVVEWFAHIYRVDSVDVPDVSTVTATINEGATVLIRRARALIDVEPPLAWHSIAAERNL